MFTFLSISRRINTRLHVKYLTNSLKLYSENAVLHNSNGTPRFGDKMTTTTAAIIIVVETMYVGLTLWLFNKYSLMLVSETSRNALLLKTITKFHCLLVGLCFSYQYFF